MENKPLLMLPGPTNVADRVMRSMMKPLVDHRSQGFKTLYRKILEDNKYIFATKNDVYPITVSGTGAVECAVGNVITRGDKVLTPTYGTFSERMREALTRYGGIPVDIPKKLGDAVTVDEVAQALDVNPDVKAVAIVYNETSTGVTVRDLPEIAKITRKQGKLLIVDAISVLCGDYLPVDEWNIDLCVAGSQKCLACPPGLALISVSKRAYEVAGANKTRPFYFDLISHKEFASHDETPFTPAIPLFYALDEALQMVKEETLEKRIQRHAACAKAFYNAFESVGLQFLAEKPLRSNTIISVHNPKDVDEKQFRQTLLNKHGIAIAGGPGKLKGLIFRIGSMGIVSRREVLATLTGIADTWKELSPSNPRDKQRMLDAASQTLSSLGY